MANNFSPFVLLICQLRFILEGSCYLLNKITVYHSTIYFGQHWLIKELIKGHPSDVAELIKSFMSWLHNNALIKMFSRQNALSWIHYTSHLQNSCFRALSRLTIGYNVFSFLSCHQHSKQDPDSPYLVLTQL